MKDFAAVTNAVGAWPDVAAVDESAPGAKDGTALQELWLNDLWGFVQAVVSGKCGVGVDPALTPDTNREVDTASQILASIRYHCGNAGEVVAWMGSVSPIPAGVRLLHLTGQFILVSDYPELVANTYCGDPANPTAPAFYRADFGDAHNTAGLYFKLPDLRGYFLRGLGGIDPESVTRTLVGSAQAESIGQHSHDGLYVGGSQAYEDVSALAGATAAAFNTAGSQIVTGSTGTGIGAGTANETRPDNIAVRYCIRY